VGPRTLKIIGPLILCVVPLHFMWAPHFCQGTYFFPRAPTFFHGPSTFLMVPLNLSDFIEMENLEDLFLFQKYKFSPCRCPPAFRRIRNAILGGSPAGMRGSTTAKIPKKFSPAASFRRCASTPCRTCAGTCALRSPTWDPGYGPG